MMLPFLRRLLPFVALASSAVASPDVVVYGETLSGISAAIQAARLGKSVVLISQTAHEIGRAHV